LFAGNHFADQIGIQQELIRLVCRLLLIPCRTRRFEIPHNNRVIGFQQQIDIAEQIREFWYQDTSKLFFKADDSAFGLREIAIEKLLRHPIGHPAQRIGCFRFAELDVVFRSVSPALLIDIQQCVECRQRFATHLRCDVKLQRSVNGTAENQARRHTVFGQPVHIPKPILERAVLKCAHSTVGQVIADHWLFNSRDHDRTSVRPFLSSSINALASRMLRSSMR